MNRAALRHLCWVLLILNGVSGIEEEQPSRPTTPVRLRRPIRRNSIKKSSEDDFKPSVFPEDSSSTTGSTRFTTKRTSVVDYLARNTVPVASVTETSRKPYRPPPSHLLTYQALSSTERGSERTNEPNLPPTGWALASMGPSKNTSTISKKNNIPLGTTRPLTSYWSTRLRRPPSLRTTPITPADSSEGSEDASGNAASAIPAENLIKDDKNATASHPKLYGDSQGAAQASAAERDNVLEKPSDTKKIEVPTTHVFPATTDNARNNLIKELRGGDIGSKILHGIIAVTNASEYSDAGHQESDKQQDISTQDETVDLHKPQDDANVVDEKDKLVTRKSGYRTTPATQVSTVTTPMTETTSNQAASNATSQEAPFTSAESQASNSTSPASTVTSSGISSTTMSSTLGETSLALTSESPKETTLLGTSTSSKEDPKFTTTSSTTSTEPAEATSSFTSEPEFEWHSDKRDYTDRSAVSSEAASMKAMANETSSQSTETISENSSSGKLEEASVSTPSMPVSSVVTETESSFIANVSESSLLPVTANSTLYQEHTVARTEYANEPQNFTTVPSVQEAVNTATTVSQEVNDIPEAYTRVKNKSDAEKSSSGDPDETLLPTTTPLSTKTSSKQRDGTVSFGTSPKFTTTSGFGRTKTTTEGVPTSTQRILETTTISVGNTVKTESENETATTWGALPATDVAKEETTSRSSVEIPTTTVKIQMPTTVRSEASESGHAATESVNVAETTTHQYEPPKGTGGTTSTEYVHTGLSEKPEDDHDDTLKYNVTTIDHPHGNGTDPDESEEEPDDEENQDVHTTTTVVIIEEITTSRPTTARPTTVPTSTSKATTQAPSSTTTTTRESVDRDVRLPTPGGPPEFSTEPRLRLTFQASFKEMCLVRESLAETIAAYFKSASTRPIQQNQVKILNLGMAECASKSLPLTEKVPVFVQITDSEGRGDQNLTDILYTYIKQSPFNFKYPLANVEHGQKPLIMEEDNQWGGTVIAAIVISSVAGVSLLCLTILLVIMRKRQKGFTYGQRCTPVSLEDYSLDNISVFNSVRRKAMRASKRSYGNPAFDDPVTVTNPLNFIGLSNMANSHQKIDSEYSEVPTVTVKPDELPPGAESKNRYANVIPIPETRVPLRGPDKEDLFINANYVKGAKGAEKFYIACQAPLESTIADFWMMIWEQQSQVILMLTDLHENGVEKSADYLPPSEVLDCHRVFGDLQVTLKKREVREKYVISSLQLRNLESNLWREVIHLWYTGWPIRGVPDDLTSIIAYLIEARSYSKPGHPIVVHCSPGTGRTGTVIAIDIAIRDFETDRTVDIPKTVYGIRRDRAGAVQTNLQYYMIYQVIHLYATKLTGGSLDSI